MSLWLGEAGAPPHVGRDARPVQGRTGHPVNGLVPGKAVGELVMAEAAARAAAEHRSVRPAAVYLQRRA